MRRWPSCVLCALMIISCRQAQQSHGWSIPPPAKPTDTRGSQSGSSRRTFLSISTSMAAVVVVVGPPSHADALDMDAFAKQQLGGGTNSQPPPLSEDAALCKYGSPAPATGAACERAGMSPKRVGTLDAYGNVDRGDFVRCKQFYDNNNGTTAYEKKTVCK
jgi:hypothetical protein